MLHVDICSVCNLKCVHCQVWKNKEKLQISFSALKNLIDQACSCGLRFLAISGGEPFMHKDLFMFIAYAKKKGLFVSITTNGTLLNEERVKKLRKLKVDAILISLDAVGGKHDEMRGQKGVYEKVVRGASFLSKYKVPFYLDPCVTEDNFEIIPDLISEVGKLNAKNIFLYPFYINTHNIGAISLRKYKSIRGPKFKKSNLKKLVGIINSLKNNKKIDCVVKACLNKFPKYFSGKDIDLKEFPCYAPLFDAVVSFNGDIYPCWASDMKMGNIYENNFSTLWRSKKYNTLRKRFRKAKHCPLTKYNCFCLTHREISARIDPLFMLKTCVFKKKRGL